MDKLTFIGLLTAFLAILLGQMIEGGDVSSLLNFPSFLIVFGGTMGAVMIQTPMATFKRAFKIISWIFFPPVLPFQESRDMLITLARKARQYGLLSLEDHLDIETNPLFCKGLELLILGVDKATIRQVMEAEIDRVEHQDLRAAHVFECMGGYSPTIGIIGAVLGLIQVMRNLANPSELGSGIAIAFVATVYGVGLANLLFLPIANKLKSYVARKVHYEEMLLEGVVALASGESPNMLQLKLDNFGVHGHHEIKKKQA